MEKKSCILLYNLKKKKVVSFVLYCQVTWGRQPFPLYSVSTPIC